MSEVIAAVSTPLMSAGLGVIRISGENAAEIADRVFRSVSGKKLAEISGYSALYGHVFDKKGDIDEVVALNFRAPHSFTGENAVELSCHGSVYILKRTLAALIAAGARLARAGEFTRRAFENGKMDLSAAESVMSLIGAESQLEHSAALSGREGVLFRRIDEIKGELTALSAHLSAWVDFPDEDVPEVSHDELYSGLKRAQKQLNRLICDFDRGKILREGIDTVIVGRPNVGKSTFMNMLCGADRSIVTDIAGTTRDIVEESVSVDGVKLRLQDTAGLHDTNDQVEKIGVEKARRRIETAALVLAVFDGSEPLSNDDLSLIKALKDRRAIAVINKCDLDMKIETELVSSVIKNTVVLSAKSGENAEMVEKAILSLSGLDGLDPTCAMMTTERQRDCAERAKSALNDGIATLEAGLTFDAVGVMLDEAIAALCELSGERVSDSIVDEVFSTFCVGK
ncbi:MAG: tRNA uridine-5-carboxymethylaminomethyl(34) synthesis GTPase MnmE [Clostridia bacterium]|nr:tRNA uridine-5-carboxymethylaminomethyl(34) synthesis GTPase MnmE [Clostridia bacterium]